MRLLLIHTCGLEGIVALAEDASIVAVERLPANRSSEHLMPAVRRLMDGRGWRVRDLAAIAVVNGPGSFTGVRTGLSAAKGLCEAGAVGMVALSRLALVAASVDAGEAVALLDAGRGEFYCGVYRGDICVSEDIVAAPAARMLAEQVQKGKGRAVTCESRVAECLDSGVSLVPEPGAEAMLAMALRRIEAEHWSDVATTDANYLRRTDAELLVKGRKA